MRLPDDDLTRWKHVGVFQNILKVFYVKLYVHLLVDKLKWYSSPVQVILWPIDSVFQFSHFIWMPKTPKCKNEHLWMIRHRFNITRAAALLQARLQLHLAVEFGARSNSVILRSVAKLLDASQPAGAVRCQPVSTVTKWHFCVAGGGGTAAPCRDSCVWPLTATLTWWTPSAVSVVSRTVSIPYLHK